jgi:cobalt-zinc-cadmium efflux system outer membrane protein
MPAMLKRQLQCRWLVLMIPGLVLMAAGCSSIAPAPSQSAVPHARLLAPDSPPSSPSKPETLPGYLVIVPPKHEEPAKPVIEPLTLDKLIDLAADNQPEIRAAQARAQAARGQLIQAGLYPNPILTWIGAQMLDKHNAAGEEGPLYLQEIVTARKLQLAERAAAHGVAAADWRAMTKWFDVMTRVRQAYYDVLTTQEEVNVSEELVDLAEKGYKAAQKMEKANALAAPDVLQARVELNQSKMRLAVSKERADAAWQLLTIAVGLPGMSAGPLVGNLKEPAPDYDWHPVAETVLTRSSEVQEALANVRQAEALLRRAQAERIPNVKLGVRPFYSFPEQDKRMDVEISMPLPCFNRNQGNIYSAEADVIRTRQGVQEVELKLQERLTSAFQRYRTARQQVELYRKEILRDADDSMRLVQQGYEKGDARYGYFALLQAQRTEAQVRLAYVQALSELWRSTAEISGLLQE